MENRFRSRLEHGELLFGSTGTAADTSLGKVSGAVITSDERMEFTIYTEFKTRSFAFRALTLKELTRWMEACEQLVTTYPTSSTRRSESTLPERV